MARDTAKRIAQVVKTLVDLPKQVAIVKGLNKNLKNVSNHRLVE